MINRILGLLLLTVAAYMCYGVVRNHNAQELVLAYQYLAAMIVCEAAAFLIVFDQGKKKV